MVVRAIDDTNFGQVCANKIGPEQLQREGRQSTPATLV
jgi:hypothetical protein